MSLPFGDRNDALEPWATGKKARIQLAREVTREANGLLGEYGMPPLSRPVIRALERVPRDAFVRDEDRAYAYFNSPLSIGHGQTISQPLIVALMTQLLSIDSHHTVLEIGTGSGYQAAVLGEIAKHVYSIEIIPALAEHARAQLAANGYHNVTVHTGDGHLGWPEKAPFDGIIITAAAPEPPLALLEQLAPDARLVMPLGDPTGLQWLSVVERDDGGDFQTQTLLAVRFVPMTRDGIS